uniref:ARAD1A13728p n=1 Tax=Blastobotrys adeninivorans TaxID=409370 RepID=A0A060T422_BLAAD
MYDFPGPKTCRNVEQEIQDSAAGALPPSDGTLDSSFSCSDAAVSRGFQGSNGPGVECIYPNPRASDSYVQCTGGLGYIAQCKSGTYQDAIKACE